MSNSLNASQAALQIFRRQVTKREVSATLLPRESLAGIRELAQSYTRPSHNALIYLEIPLESQGPLDVQFCLTECLRLPSLTQLDLRQHYKLLAWAENMGDKVGADFAFDAAYAYAAAPCLYAYMPKYEPALAEGFFEAVGAPCYSKICREIIAKAPKDYNAYYVGLMQSREPAYARIGFRHRGTQRRYQKDIMSFVQDLRSLGYDKPLDPKMRQELAEAAQYGFLQDTQVSVLPNGTFVDRLAMDSVYSDRDRTFPALNLIKNVKVRAEVAAELAKCCFAVQSSVRDPQGVQRMITLRSFIQYLKCTWVNGEKGELKAYLALSASFD